MNATVAIFATTSRVSVANRETDVAKSARYMLEMLSEWLQKALKFSNISQAELARRLTERLHRSIDRAAVNKMVKGPGRNGRAIAADEMIAIAEITRFPPPEPESPIAPRTVQVVGYVGAGANAVLFSEGQLDPEDRVPAPEGATDETVAVEIRGESLGALFDKWLVFYDDVRDPPNSSFAGRLCVCWLDDGRVLVKKMKRGQLVDHWTLISNIDPPIYDVVVIRAAKVKLMAPR